MFHVLISGVMETRIERFKSKVEIENKLVYVTNIIEEIANKIFRTKVHRMNRKVIERHSKF
jgi:hypothetical protein